jgi:hypothetical protein
MRRPYGKLCAPALSISSIRKVNETIGELNLSGPAEVTSRWKIYPTGLKA